ncbi:MAG: hypothetical protein K6G69_09500 [Lachnospiraceae bacterium]|nr:hypothetical protein [Lachnospiraceae bacterium]
MKNTDALKILQDYYDNGNPTEDEEFLFVEALNYLIDQTKDPRYMTELGWYYCSQKRFDLEIRYLEMAAEYGYLPAMEELGYMWYYGQHGEQDYKKAFYYFSKGAGDDKTPGSLWCRYKLADMYRFGCGVKKNEKRYRQMIEKAYKDVKDAQHLNDPYPEICYRLAGIRAEDGADAAAIALLKNAKAFMAERLSWEAFWGHIEVMGRIVRMLYGLMPVDMEAFDFYDMFYLADHPGKYTFDMNGERYAIDVSDDEERAVGFDGKWYRTFEDLCNKAEIEGRRFTTVYDELQDWRIENE